MKTPLGTEVDIDAGHIVLDGLPALRERGTAPPPSFRPMSIVATVTHLSYCRALVRLFCRAHVINWVQPAQVNTKRPPLFTAWQT